MFRAREHFVALDINLPSIYYCMLKVEHLIYYLLWIKISPPPTSENGFIFDTAPISFALHWSHNDYDGVSNHQPHGCLLNRLFRRRSKKTSKLRVTGLCAGNSPHKGSVTRKMVPFDDVIMDLFLQRCFSFSPSNFLQLTLQFLMCHVICYNELPWWRYQMETFAALLALCEVNPPVTNEFPSQMPVTRNFDVFFDLHLNKRISKHSRRRWFQLPSRSLWHHRNAVQIGPNLFCSQMKA